MKKTVIFFFIFTALFSSATVHAQVKVEPYIGLTYPMRNIGNSEIKETAGLNAGIEVRKNLSSLPIAVGADFFVATSARQKEKLEGGHSSNSQRMAGIAAVCDYHLFQDQPVSLFIGTGIGVSQRHTIRSGIDTNIGICSEYGPVVSPRIGMELWKHVRISAEARITQRDYNVIAFRIGYAIGGSRK